MATHPLAIIPDAPRPVFLSKPIDFPPGSQNIYSSREIGGPLLGRGSCHVPRRPYSLGSLRGVERPPRIFYQTDALSSRADTGRKNDKAPELHAAIKTVHYLLDKYHKLYDTINMPIDGIEWDSKKARINLEKHGVSFETAQYIFSDPQRLWRLDRSESNVSDEERWQTLGQVGETLLVVYTERGTTKQLIMARLATKTERRSYNGYYQIDGKGWTKAE